MDPRLVTQRDAAIAWLASDDARLTPARQVRKYGLSDDPDDLLSEAGVRVHESLSRRAEPLVGSDVQSVATKYAARSLGNVAIDNARRRARSKKYEVELAHTLPTQMGPERQVEAVVFIEELNAQVNELMRVGAPCPGCQKEVVFAATTEVMQLVLVEGNTTDASSGNADWFDDAIQTVIDRLSPGSSTAAARRKRRLRCKNCVMELLGTALRRIGYRRG